MCGKRFTFLYTSPYEHVQYNASGPWVKYFWLNKCSEKNIHDYFVIKSLKGFGWNYAGQRHRRWPSITSALGHCIVLSGVSGAGMLKRLQHNAAIRNTVQSPNAVSMTVGQH